MVRGLGRATWLGWADAVVIVAEVGLDTGCVGRAGDQGRGTVRGRGVT